MIVLDANILIRAILGRRVRELIETYYGQGIRFTAPEEVFRDAEDYLPSVLNKFGRHDLDISASLRYLRILIEVLDRDLYTPFEEEARLRLRGRDEEDWPVLACALALACPVWTEDSDFFGTGVAVWNTSRVEIYLKSQAQPRESEQE